jgi:YgiT-type zinc finger domain-containing protein
MNEAWEERLVERLVTYTLEIDGQVIVVEHVPARVNEETGERYFSPATVEKLREIIRERREPSRVIETPVFNFAA